MLIGGRRWGGKVVSRTGGHPWLGVVARGAVPPGVLRQCAAAGSALALMAGGCAATQAVLAPPVSAASSQGGTAAATVTLTASAASVSFGTPVTLTATMTPADASGSVTFTDLLSTGPQSGQAVTLGTAALSGGTAALTASLPAFGTNAVTANYSGDATYAPGTSTPVGVQVNAYSGEVVISQFRLSGPDGANDQYVELYNTGAAVSLAGFTLAAGSGASVTVPDSAPVLPADQTYLIAGDGYSLSASPDQSAANLGSDGLRVTAPDGTVVDAVGPAGAPAGFFSGTPLPAFDETSPGPADQYAWVRIEVAGVPHDSGSNAADFTLVSTTGGVVGGVKSALGSPSPRASVSPSQTNGAVQSVLLDPATPAPDAPNLFYTKGSPGLLTVERTITNTSTDDLTTAEIHITSLSEANGAPEPGVASQPAQPAALRIIDPAAATSTVTVGGNPVTVQNLSVDAPAGGSPGGGVGSTLSVPLPAGGLVPGASVNIAFTFAVDNGGRYWFGYDVDVLTEAAGAGASVAHGSAAALPALGVSPPQAYSASGSLPATSRALRNAGASGVVP